MIVSVSSFESNYKEDCSDRKKLTFEVNIHKSIPILILHIHCLSIRRIDACTVEDSIDRAAIPEDRFNMLCYCNCVRHIQFATVSGILVDALCNAEVARL